MDSNEYANKHIIIYINRQPHSNTDNNTDEFRNAYVDSY